MTQDDPRYEKNDSIIGEPIEEPDQLGVVYILVNSAMPDLVKLGRVESSQNLAEWIRDLSAHSGVPVPFQCFYACTVDDPEKVEQKLHAIFQDDRTNPKREFFRIDPERPRSILELVCREDVTPGDGDVAEDNEDLATIKMESDRRGRFNFSMVGIKPGSILTFSKNDSIEAKVVNNHHIEYNGQICSLSQSARSIFQEMGRRGSAYRGPDYWRYEKESLSERRDRMEEAE